MIAEVDDDGSNEIEFSEFLKVPNPATPHSPAPAAQPRIPLSAALQSLWRESLTALAGQVIENQKKRDSRADDDSDTVLAYVALGGNSDKTGAI